MKTLLTKTLALSPLIAIIFVTVVTADSNNITLEASPLGLNDNITNVLLVRYHVNITNNYKNPDLRLQVQCWRNHEELDMQNLNQGESYVMWLKINLWRTTKCRCYVAEKWDDGSGRVGFSRYIDGFKASRDEDRCGYYNRKYTCFWSVREDGFYFSNNNANWSLEYLWTDI